MGEVERITRKKFLTGAGGITAAAAGLVMGTGLFLGGCSSGNQVQDQQSLSEAPKWPWPYQKLDPEAVRKRAYNSWYEGGCTYGVTEGVVGSLRETIGYPYNLLPLDMFRFGEGGVAGWSTLCGTLIGGGAVLTLVGGDAYSKLVHELMGFYTEAEFPNPKHDEWAKFTGQTRSVSGSPLCHVSVTHWVKASGHKSFSEAGRPLCQGCRRCCRLRGGVA